jgi:hypothetical protein
MTPLGRIGPTIFLLTCALSASAAEPADPLTLIPPKAIAVIQVNGLERTQDRLEKFLKNAVPDQADRASRSVRDAITDAFDGRDAKALRADGRILIAISDLEKLPDTATLTFLFPVKSEDEFKKGFLTEAERKSLAKDGDLQTVKLEDRPEPFYLVPLSGYVAACTDKETAGQFAKGQISGIGGQLSRETAAAFLDADLSLYVNVREVNALYGTQLKTYKSLADLFLRGDAVQGVNKAQMEQLKAVLDATFKVVEDGTAAVLAVQFRPDGLAVKSVAQFGEKSGTNGTLNGHKLAPLQQLGSLPVGQVSYTASVLSHGARSTNILAGEFSIRDDDGDTKKAITGVLREVGSVDPGITLSAGKVFSPEGMEVIESKDAARIVSGRLRVAKALTQEAMFAHIPLREKPAVQENAEKVGGFTLHAIKVKLDFEKAVADLDDAAKEAARNSLKKVLGGDELGVWIGSDGKVALQVIARDWSAAKRQAEAYLDENQSLDKNAAYQAVRKQLPAEPTMLIVLDAAQTVYSVFGMARDSTGAIPGLPFNLPEDGKQPAGKPLYVGMALVLKPEHGCFEVFVPAAAVGRIQKLLEPLLDKGE